jgi:DNA-binding CsgD family transcriptional regulator/PAS domain-containing protein
VARLTASDDHRDLSLRLIDLIYEAALDRRLWQRFVEDLSAVFGDSPVSLWMELPGTRATPEHYTARLDPALQPTFDELFTQGTPFGSEIEVDAAERFTLLDGYITDEELAASRLYRDWMRPQGIAPARPMVHAFGTHDGKAVASVAIHRVAGSLPFSSEDFAFADRLVPHLNRAFRIRRRVRGLERGREIFTEVLDRLPTGILVLDETGKMMACNRAAELSTEGSSHLRIEEGRLTADDRVENERLQELIKNAVAPDIGSDLDARNAMRITVDSDGSQLPIFIRPLLRASIDSRLPDASAVIFFAAPIWKQASALASIRALYGFTHAEAEIAQLLCQGLSLEEVAERRGVKLSTARSQLKSAFAKTGAKRQGDLVRIILGGIGSHQG